MSGVLVGGMHFSGLDLATSALEAAGWELAGAPQADPSRGTTLDDPRVGKLHLRWLRNIGNSPRALSSWGVAGQLDVRALAEEALSDPNPMGLPGVCHRFAMERSSFGLKWLAQDALSVFSARIWAAATPVNFVFVYRNPWDCVDEAVRTGQPGLADDPDFVRGTWLHFNRLVAEFACEFPERCTVVAAEALAADPGVMARHVGTDPAAGVEHPAAELAVRDDASPIAAVYRQVYPELVELLDELDDVADIPRPTSRVAAVEQWVPNRVGPAGKSPEGTGTQVVIVCRDDVTYLAESVASVIASATAALRDVELTIVDDSSTDAETLTLLQRLRDAGLEVMVTSGVGEPAARNVATAASATACILPLDQRSRLLPPLLAGEELVASGACDVVLGPWRQLGAQSEVHTPPEPTAVTMFPRNRMPDTALIARSAVQAVGGWDEGAVWADWDFWLSCLERRARFQLMVEPTHESWAHEGPAESGNPAIRERGFQSLANKHGALLSQHLGSYIAGLDAEAHRLRSALALSKAEARMSRRVVTKANRRLTEELEQARAGIVRLRSELEGRIGRIAGQATSRRVTPSRPITVHDPLLFLHVQKTGGTSFRRMMQKEFSASLVYPSDEDLRRSPKADYPTRSEVAHWQDNLPPHAVLVGHFEAGIIDALQRGYRTAVFLRNPTERALSHLAWRSLMDGRDVEYYLGLPEFLQHTVGNLQTRVLAGEEHHGPRPLTDKELLEGALTTLSRLDFVGITEEFFSSCVRFDEMFGTSISGRVRWDNVVRPTGDELAQFADALAPYLELDTVLYQRALAKIAADGTVATR